MSIELFKGGQGRQKKDRAIINQRPADGHLKSGVWEDFIRVTPRLIREYHNEKLKVGDILYIHTTLTFGVVHGLGFAVTTPQEGLKFKVVSSDPNFDLSKIKARRYKYDAANKEFKDLDGADVGLDSLMEIGNEELYIAGYAEPSELLRVGNALQIGLEVVSVPSDGIPYDFEIESRLHMQQSVRPPAYLESC